MTQLSRLVALGLAPLLLAATPVIPTPTHQSASPAIDTERASADDLPTGVELIEVPTDGQVLVDPREDLRSLLLDAVDPREATDLVGAVARHIAEVWEASDLLIAPSAEDPMVETAPIAGGTFIDGRAAMDTDGDGRDDVVLTATDAGSGATDLVALRGLDGREQWRTPLGSWDESVGWPAGDLTGDGIEDLFALDLDYGEFTADEQCDDAGCEGFVHETFLWELSARSGADGNLLWQEDHPGEYRVDYVDRQSEDGWEYSWTVEAEGLAALPYPGADHDGDGGRDVLVNTLDLTESFTETNGSGATGTSREGAYDLDSSTTARIVRGADGSDLAAALTSRGPSIAALRLAGDATGDGTADLLWSRIEYDTDTWTCDGVVVVEICDDEQTIDPPQLQVDLLDGADFSTVWTFTAPQGLYRAYAQPLLEDVDGAPGTEVLVRVAAEGQPEATSDPLDDGAAADDVALLSGADGSVAWRADDPGGGPWALAEMGGAAGPDLLFTSWAIRATSCSTPLPDPVPQGCGDSVSATQMAIRLDGTTGGLLSDTSRTYDLGESADYFWFSLRSSAGDHDGDGVLDPAMALGTDEQSVAVVQSAVTGDPLFEHLGEDQLLLSSGGGDLDGTGTDELGTYLWSEDRFEILRMPGGELLHDLSRIEGTLYAGGDQDGVRGDELLRVRHHLDGSGHLHATVDSLHGETLAPRWSLAVTTS